MGKKILMIGVYGNDLIMSAGAMAKNVKKGGESYASVMLCNPVMQVEMQEIADILGLKKIYFNNFKMGEINTDHVHKLELVKVIREVKPEIIVTQDPEECVSDLDPDRRPAMTLILESIALASRDFALEELPGLEPHPIPPIYYKTPHHPNCVIDVTEVWELKKKATAKYKILYEFLARHYEKKIPGEALDVIIDGYSQIESYYEKGLKLHSAIDMAKYVNYGYGGHGSAIMGEAYRYEGLIELDDFL